VQRVAEQPVRDRSRSGADAVDELRRQENLRQEVANRERELARMQGNTLRLRERLAQLPPRQAPGSDQLSMPSNGLSATQTTQPTRYMPHRYESRPVESSAAGTGLPPSRDSRREREPHAIHQTIMSFSGPGSFRPGHTRTASDRNLTRSGAVPSEMPEREPPSRDSLRGRMRSEDPERLPQFGRTQPSEAFNQ
jgi:hypothetical protein